MLQLLATFCLFTIMTFLVSGIAGVRLELRNRISYVFLFFIILLCIWLLTVFLDILYPGEARFFESHIFPMIYLIPAVVLSIIIGFTSKKMDYFGWWSILLFFPILLGVVGFYIEGDIPENYSEWSRGVVYRSQNGGKDWEELWRGEGFEQPHSILFAGEHQETVFIPAGDLNQEFYDVERWEAGKWLGKGILKSVNHGDSWKIIDEDNGLNVTTVTAVDSQPNNPELLLAGAGDNLHPERGEEFDRRIAGGAENPFGIYKSEDNGESWRQVFSFKGEHTVFEIVHTLSFSKANPKVVYGASPKCILRSNDSGESWNIVAGGTPQGWLPERHNLTDPITIHTDKKDPEVLTVITAGSGFFRSNDGGKTFSIIKSRPSTASIWDGLFIDDKFIGCGECGIWMSSISLESWEPIGIPEEKAESNRFSAVAKIPEDNRIITAGVPFNGFLISENLGETWNSPVFPEASPEFQHGPLEITDITAAPSNPDVVYASTANILCKTKHEPVFYDGFIIKSEDGGRNWQYLPSEQFRDTAVLEIAVSPANAEKVFAAASNGIFFSSDGGDSWEQLLTSENKCECVFRSIDINPQEEDSLLVGYDGGLYYSTNSGKTWETGTVINSQYDEDTFLSVQSVKFDPNNPEHAVAIEFEKSCLLESWDRGRTWNITPLPGFKRLHGIVFQPGGNRTYILTDGSGIIALGKGYARKGPPVGRVYGAESEDSICGTVDPVGGLLLHDDASGKWKHYQCRSEAIRCSNDGSSCVDIAQLEPMKIYTGSQGAPVVSRWKISERGNLHEEMNAEVVSPLKEGFMVVRDIAVSPNDSGLIFAAMEEVRRIDEALFTPFPWLPWYTVPSPLRIIYHGFSIIFFIISLVLAVNLFRKKRAGIWEVAVVCVLSAVIIPLLLLMENQLFRIPGMTADITITVYLAIFSIILVVLLRRYNLEIIKPRRLAKDLIAGIQTPILVTDFSGRIIAVNSKTVNTFGYHPKEMESLTLDSLFLKINGMKIPEINLKEYAKGSRSFRSICLCKEGKEFECVISFSFLRNKVEQDLGYIMSLTQNPEFEAVENRFNFTDREMEIIKLIVRGLSYQDIAEQLYISLATVKTHVHHIYEKSGAKNRFHLMQLLK